jgi:hypothetical protein
MLEQMFGNVSTAVAVTLRGGGRRTVFGKEFENVCCNVFQLANPNNEEQEKIKKLMELQKHIIAESKK